MRLIELTQGKQAIIDDCDYDLVSKFKWHANYKNYRYWYAVCTRGKQAISMHRLILNAPSDKACDHANHNGLDNRRCNIRLCDYSENKGNGLPHKSYAKLPCSSRYKGVSWNRQGGKWTARIKKGLNDYHLGYYDKEDDAALAYNLHAVMLFGKFAYLNNVATFRGATIGASCQRQPLNTSS